MLRLGPTLQSLFLICGSAGSTYFVVYSRQIIIAGRIANPQLNRRRTDRYETPLRGYITIIISISQVISRRLSIPQHPIRFRIWQSARCTKQQRTHHYSNLPGEVKQLENHLMLCTDCKKKQPAIVSTSYNILCLLPLNKSVDESHRDTPIFG